jgi:5,10-methylenetetrahydromethanopterin reductase
VSEYVRALRGLLRGELVEWEGRAIRMMHPTGYAAARPLDVPCVIAAAGAKGVAAARELGDGVFGSAPISGFSWSVLLAMGTVLAPGESAGSERALAAAGHAASVQLHWALEHGQLGALPNGAEWAAVYAREPARTRHLALHDQHLIAINPRDAAFVSGELLAKSGLALDRAGWRAKLAALEAQGVTELAYQPAGPDVPRELEAMADAAR